MRTTFPILPLLLLAVTGCMRAAPDQSEMAIEETAGEASRGGAPSPAPAPPPPPPLAPVGSAARQTPAPPAVSARKLIKTVDIQMRASAATSRA